METFEDFIKRVVRAFNQSGLEYAITGALAASYYGRPRTTMDMDIIVKVDTQSLPKLTETLKRAELKVDERTVESAWRSHYRVVMAEDRRSPHTLDAILRDREIERRKGSILGIPCFYEAPEPLILAKLRMMRATAHPERLAIDREDVKAILRHTKIDKVTLEKRAVEQGLINLLLPLLS